MTHGSDHDAARLERRATGSTSRAARSGSACGHPGPSCRSGPSGSAPRSTAAGAPVVEAEDAPDDIALRFHDPALVAWLRDAWDAWEAVGADEDPGQDRVVPYLFPHPGLLGELPLIDPAATTARAGRFAYDTMTLIGPGTWEAAAGAVDAALTAAASSLPERRAAYACCRPPGHHATARRLRRLLLPQQRRGGGGSARATRSAARSRCSTSTPTTATAPSRSSTPTRVSLTGSVHVDPGAGWFPHFLGFADRARRRRRRGREPEPPARARLRRRPVARGGRGALRVGARGRRRRGAGRRARRRRRRRRPGEPARGHRRRLPRRRAGSSASSACRPSIVQEGGYDLERIGELVVATLEGSTPDAREASSRRTEVSSRGSTSASAIASQVELGHLGEVGDVDRLVGPVHAVEVDGQRRREHRREAVGVRPERAAHPVRVGEAGRDDRQQLGAGEPLAQRTPRRAGRAACRSATPCRPRAARAARSRSRPRRRSPRPTCSRMSSIDPARATPGSRRRRRRTAG